MNINNAIATLNAKFPKLNAVSTEEWDGTEGGIWFRMEGECHPDGRPYYDYYTLDPSYNFGVHPDLDKTLESLGLHAEPYDAGTLMAYD
jgi:hypothetical protein